MRNILLVAVLAGSASLASAQTTQVWRFEDVGSGNIIPGCVRGMTVAGFEYDVHGRPVHEDRLGLRRHVAQHAELAALQERRKAAVQGRLAECVRALRERHGFRDGFEGLLPPGDYQTLEPDKIAGILKLGGTILGTTNKGSFAAKVGVGDVLQVAPEIIEKARATLGILEIRALIIVGEMAP